MKKLFLAIAFIITISPSFAQLFMVAGQEIGFVYIGPKVGANFSKISNWTTTGVDNKNRIGYQFGAIGEFGLTNQISFQSELTFISRGMKRDDGFGTTTLRVNYLGIPLLAKYTFRLMNLSRVYAMGGTYANVRTGGSYSYVYEGEEGYTETLSSDGWRRTDWGLSLGVGGEYDTEYGIWGLDLRYDLGLIDVHVSDAENKNRNRTFGFTLVYKYDLVDLMLRLRSN